MSLLDNLKVFFRPKACEVEDMNSREVTCRKLCWQDSLFLSLPFSFNLDEVKICLFLSIQSVG